jgi:hypothetical protein
MKSLSELKSGEVIHKEDIFSGITAEHIHVCRSSSINNLKTEDIFDLRIDGNAIVSERIISGKIDYLALKDCIKTDTDLSLKYAFCFFQIAFNIIAKIIRKKIGI